MSNFLLWQIAYSELVFTDVLLAGLPARRPLRGGLRVPATRAPIRRRETVTIRIVAVVLGVLLLGGTIVLAVAAASSPHSNAMGPLAFLALHRRSRRDDRARGHASEVVTTPAGHRKGSPSQSGPRGLTADPATDDQDQPSEST